MHSDLMERSDSWPEVNPMFTSSSSYKNLITKLLPSMIKEMNPSNNNQLGLRDWDKFDSVYQGNDGLVMGQ